VIGAVYVDNPFRAAIFEEKDKEFLQAIADLAAIAIDNARQYERSEFLRQVFEVHVNKQVTDYVLTRSGRTLTFIQGERREVTMLNSDIAGFSTLSQSMDAEELVSFLNDYFQRMIRVVLEQGGNIDKFQGDGMLVVFGAPNPMHDHAERALNAALAMVREVEAFNRELLESGREAISVGMGLDTGEVVAGHVGSGDRMEFTLIGVPVNNSAYLSKVRCARRGVDVGDDASAGPRGLPGQHVRADGAQRRKEAAGDLRAGPDPGLTPGRGSPPLPIGERVGERGLSLFYP
jgi:adenylate cyclase